MRNLIIVLGDQLDLNAAAFDEFDMEQDAVWMAEVSAESENVWSSKSRIALFLSGMRHFAQSLHQGGRSVHYISLDDTQNCGTLDGELSRFVAKLQPLRLIMTAPGDWRVWTSLKAVARRHYIRLEVRPDRHFYTSVGDFSAYERGMKGRPMRLEFFYRELRRRFNVLMSDDRPEGDVWNFDKFNRRAFDGEGPGLMPGPLRFEPDAITRDVIELVERRFGDHPGELTSFGWAVTRSQALRALKDFIDHRLPMFGRYQDAMWAGEPWLYHSQLSASLNLKLLNPREVVAAAERAFRLGLAPLPSVEGFIRQILGWREYVRGLYWTRMPSYLERNELGAEEALPGWYWTSETDFECLHDAIGQTLRHGYAHHIQRLMVTGLFALMYGVRPREVHEWYLAVYVDAVEWVELPNTLGMSQYADGGLMGSKPYVATGKYIQRMGGPCGRCRYDPAVAQGPTACPFTTLHWDFLMKHESRFAGHPRLVHQMARVRAFDEPQRKAIRDRAGEIRNGGVGHTRVDGHEDS